MIRRMLIGAGFVLYLGFFFLLLLAMHTALKSNVHPALNLKIKRIVSLSPSITDQVNDLGAAEMLAGVTPFNPEYSGNAEIIGNYVRPDLEKIMKLQPDIVFISHEDSAQSAVIPERFGLKCYRFGRAVTFEDICANYMILAEMTGREKDGTANITRYRDRLARISRPEHEPGVVFLVSVKPLITVSGSSYISSAIRQAGGRNLFEKGNTPYPILNMEALLLSDPDVVIVMNPVDKDYLENYLKKFRTLRFVSRRNIYATGDRSIPYYSPERYVESVEILSGIIAGMNR